MLRGFDADVISTEMKAKNKKSCSRGGWPARVTKVPTFCLKLLFMELFKEDDVED